MKLTCLIRLGLAVVISLGSILFSSNARADEIGIQSLGWGGGGAFTSTAMLNNEIYLSSDVTGIWKQAQGKWQPYVEGLGNYNVTSLATFNNSLYAITSTELFVSNGNDEWSSTNIYLNTYRGSTDQAFAVSANEELLCIANRNQKIDCINTENQLTSYATPETLIKNVYFDHQNSDRLYFSSGSELYVLDLDTHASELIYSFNNTIVAFAKYGSQHLIATQKQVFDLLNLDQEMLNTGNSSIINFFVATHDDTDVAFISTGSKWGTYPKRFDLQDGQLIQQQSVKKSFDQSLPHRPYQKYLNKFLGISELNGSTWITDYWGVYQLIVSNDDGVPEILEVTSNAVNIVATDLAITDNNIYISAMDNGVVRMSKPIDNSITQYEALSFSSLQGHAWSLLLQGDTVHGVVSPWSDANDYLFSYNESDAETNNVALTNYSTRPSSGAFWGDAYSRQLVDYNGIVTFRDGSDGGLFAYNNNSINQNGTISLGDQNRVFRSIVSHEGLLYIANCEGMSQLLAINASGDIEITSALPNGFCPFTAYSFQDKLYFLGSKAGNSVIYQFENEEFSLLVSENVGSSFYSMAINPQNYEQIVAATTSWSNKSTSGLFVSLDQGQTFFDRSCVLSHKNGVVAIRFDQDTAYILQKVGGLRAVPTSTLFSQEECSKTTEEPLEQAVNFNLVNMQAYGYGQDTPRGTVSIEDDGATLKLTGNRWRAANFDYTITPSTVIEFEFKSSAKGEIHGLGLDSNLSLSSATTFNFFGTQRYGLQDYTYTGSGEYEHFSVPIGLYYTGNIHYLFFAMDHDVSRPSGESYFHNVRVVER